jgi:hypothetical protein
MKYSDRPIRGPVAISRVHTGARRVDMDNSSESPEKASKHSHNSNLVVENREYIAAYQPNSCYPEIPMGELVNPKSTVKHVFGTGKASQASLRREVLFKDIGLIGVGCRRNYIDVRISAADMFVDSTLCYGNEVQMTVTEDRKI